MALQRNNEAELTSETLQISILASPHLFENVGRLEP